MIREKIQTFSYMKITDKLNTISYIVFCIIAIDCSLTGGGHWLMAGPFSIRMILGVLAVVAAIPSIILNIRQWYKDPMLISLLLFVVYVAFCAFRGVKNGNPSNLLLMDIKGFAWLFLVPVAVAVINKPERLITLMRCLAVTAVLQALIILVFNTIFVLDADTYHVFYRTWMDIQMATVDHISDTTYRFFFNSAPYMVIGILCMVYFQLRAPRFNVAFSVGVGLCLTALMLTFTRSIYGAVFISFGLALILAFIYYARQRKVLIIQVSVAIAVLMLLVTLQQIVLGCNNAQFAFARTFNMEIPDESANEEITQGAHDSTQPNEEITQGAHDSAQAYEEVTEEVLPVQQQHQYIEDTKNSDIIRQVTLQELHEMIQQNPVFGNGLGAAIASREGGLVEYFYQDLINKTGLVGILLYYFPIGYMVFTMVRKGKSSHPDLKLLKIIWFSGLGVFLLATYFNPYMNSSLGICCYSIAIACFRLKAENTSDGAASI